MTDDLYSHYEATVRAVAYNIGKSYRSYVSIEDVEQEMWQWMFTYPDPFRRYATNGPLSAAQAALGQVAHRYCEKQRTAFLGLTEPQYDLYSPKAVRELLNDCFEYEDWQSFATKNDAMPRTKRLEATSDRLAMLIDVKTATAKLPVREYSIIIGRFKYRYNDEQMADMLEIAPGSVASTVSRAVKQLTELLNPTQVEHEYVGKRKVKSNAAARAETSNQWEGN